jgi:predicted DNA-binding WGR domain protein
MNGWQGKHCYVTYKDPDANADKWYEAVVLWNDALGDNRVVFRWGRYGAKGSSKSSIFPNSAHAEYEANKQINAKLRKGYEWAQVWETLDPEELLEVLQIAGVNTNIEVIPKITVDGGVTFEEMSTLVGNLLTNAIGKDNDAGDVAVEAATVNAKFAVLREQYENLQSEVEFVNTAVRSRM